MARAGDIVGDPLTGARITFRRTAADTEGELLQLDVVAAPRWTAGPTHVHPKQEERVEVLAGTLRSRIGRRNATHGPSDAVRIPPGTPHTLWNAGDDQLRLVVEFRPSLRMEAAFEIGFGVGRTRRTRTPLRELARLVLVSRGYRDEVRLARPTLVEIRAAIGVVHQLVLNVVRALRKLRGR